ncbi:ribosome silencing factor [bacterium]|nr:ribosome silencing factor [bacterium]
MEAQALPDLIKRIHRIVLEKKGENPLLFDLRDLTPFSDFFYIVSGWSDRQVRAIYKEIEAQLHKENIYPLHVEGEETAHWILMDYGQVIIHIFLQESRKFYDLEHLWADSASIDLSTLEHDA